MPYRWTPEGSFRLFLSHLSDQHAFAAELREWFKQFGIAAFVAHQDIEPTHEWQAMIESALNSMDALVALLHPNFHTSKWCDQEVGIGIGKQKLVVSVRLGADPHGFIGKYQAVSGLGMKRTVLQIAEQLAAIFATNPSTSRAVARGAVHLLRAANSWVDAKKTMTFIETIVSADPETIEMLETTQNDQVLSAWHVPARITAVVQKWQQAEVASTTSSGGEQ